MIEEEIIIGWTGSLVILVVLFKLLNKRIDADKPLSIWMKLLTVGICFHINVIFSLLLYDVVIAFFKVNMDGFMNLNGILTLFIIWFLLSAIIFSLTKVLKELLGGYYKTIRTTQMVFLFLPFVIVFLLLFAINLK